MTFLLDTDHISILQKQSGPEYAVLLARIAQVRRADLAFCIVSFHEQVLGCNAYLAQAKTSADVERGYRMFDRVLAALMITTKNTKNTKRNKETMETDETGYRQQTAATDRTRTWPRR